MGHGVSAPDLQRRRLLGQVGYHVANAEASADLGAYPWPDPDWYDYSALPDLCAQYEGRAIEIVYTQIFTITTNCGGWSFR
jgi:hypothetical protein